MLAYRFIQHDHTLDTPTARFQRSINDLFELCVLAFAIRDIGGKEEARAACLHAVVQRICTKTCKHDDVNRANARGSKHQHDRLGEGRHVNRDAITFLNAHPAQCCRHSFNLVK